jgi:predicted dehydrogenase
MNRRDFTRLSTLAAASTRLPNAFAQAAVTGGSAKAEKPIGFAVVGIGSISTAFMEACAASASVKIAALVTGHPETKGVQFSQMYGIPKSSVYTYESFDRVRENKDIDALYIGLPNSMHCEYTVRGAQAGKHVLCEKPMAISSAECRTMIEACRKADRKLMIAYRMQYDPVWQKAFGIVQSGALGKIQSFRGSMLQSQAMGWRQTKRYGGGGPMMDLGIYPLNGIRYLTQEEPLEFTAMVATRDRDDPRFAEVEQSAEWTMKFPSGIIASCGCSYGQFGPQTLSVHGDKGYISLSPAFGGGGIHLTGKAGDKTFDETGTGKGHFQLGLEGEHMAACIRSNTQPKSPGEEGLKDLVAIERIYQAAGTPIA